MNPTRLYAWLCGLAAVLLIFTSRAATLPLEITEHPQDLIVFECQVATFNVSFTGTAEAVLWYRDGVLKTNALSYTLPERVTLSDNESRIHVVLSNSLGSITSFVATLWVDMDPLPFRVASVINCPEAAQSRLLVSFATCPPLNDAEITNAANYKLSGWPMVWKAERMSPTNVLLSTWPIPPGGPYTLTVTNIRDLKGNYISSAPTLVPYVAISETNFVITLQPSNVLKYAGAAVTLQFLVQGLTPCFTTNSYASVSYQWQRRHTTNSFADVAGATSSTYSFYAEAPFCWGGTFEYRALASANVMSVTSRTATVQAYIDDANFPTLSSASCSTLDRSRVSLKFNQLSFPINFQSATNRDLYSINNGVTVLSARYGTNWFGTDNHEVVLTTTPLTNGASYVVSVTNIQGYCEVPPELLSAPQRAYIPLLGPHASAGHDYIYFEAEDFDANISPGTGFSGTWWRQNFSYVEASAGMTSPVLPINTWRLDYQVTFPNAGVWYVWVRGRSQGSQGPGIWVGLDGIAITTAGDGANRWNGTNYLWSTEKNAGRSYLSVTNAGPHTLNLWAYPYSSFTFVDAILLTTNAAFNIVPRSSDWTNEVNCASVASPKPDACIWPPPRESTLDKSLHVRRAGSNWELTWPAGGVLQETTNAPMQYWFYYGPWEDVTNATSPLIISNGPVRFFRVKFF